jgi:hypothetical protein
MHEYALCVEYVCLYVAKACMKLRTVLTVRELEDEVLAMER